MDDFSGRQGCRPLRQARMPDATIRLQAGVCTVNLGFMPDAIQNQTPESTPPNLLIAGLHFRGKLPHLKKEGAVYFVTFRLADSLPAHAVARLKHERRAVLEQARAGKSPLTWYEEQQLLAWYCDKVEALLDAGHGACWLSKPNVANLVSGALKHFDGQRYGLRAWVVMPNHVHAVVWPRPGHTLSSILHSWKSFTSSKANEMLHRTGKGFWQTESFDHWIRDDEEHARLAAYVVNNPVKAGFCQRPEDWAWSNASGRPSA